MNDDPPWPVPADIRIRELEAEVDRLQEEVMGLHLSEGYERGYEMGMASAEKFAQEYHRRAAEIRQLKGDVERLQAVADAAREAATVHEQSEKAGWDETWLDILASDMARLRVRLAALDGSPSPEVTP